MECPICLECVPDYLLNGCSHSICRSCADQMAKHTTDEFTPFGKEMYTYLHMSRLTCPLCRAQEVMTASFRKELNETYPIAYKIWFQLELFRDMDGTMYYTSLRKANFRLFPTEPRDIYSLLERMEYTARTTSCYREYHNLYEDPDYFLLWYPVQHKYPSIKLNHLSTKHI
jgi:hypothetical protein